MTIRIPTDLKDEQVDEFMILYKKHFGKNISRTFAKKEAIRLITMFGILINASDEYHNKA